ncbi:MAG: hypothetical protein IIW48_03400 [Clostridia bacterium]|nr:hypothetical protein [Clostridia bacterium]
MQKNVTTFDYAQLRRSVYGFKEKYPFVGCCVCARSWSGRAVFSLSLGSAQSPALFVAGIRGGDTVSVRVMLKFFERLCEAVETDNDLAGIRIGEVLKEKGIIIIPCLNPDGMEISLKGAVAAGSYAGLVERVCSDTSSWRANARGIDLNLNFSSDFIGSKKAAENCGYTAPGPYFHAGKVPESEPETRALVRLCGTKSVRHTLTLENGGSYVYSPRCDEGMERIEMMSRILELSSGISRLKESPSPLEKHGFADWFVKKHKRPSFVLNADGSECEVYAVLEEMLVLSIVM